MRARILGTGSFVPQGVVTNLDLEKKVETSDEWIRARTGIIERRVSDEKTATSDLAYEASKRAIESAKLSKKDIELIIVATCTPDVLFPSVACVIQDKLGATNAAGFDVSAACSGFNFAMSVASKYIETGTYKNILVVGADTLTKYVDWKDRNICILFGDGAGAVVLQATNEDCGILGSYLKVKGEGGKFLVMPQKGFICMDGKEVFKFAVRALEESVLEVLRLTNLSMSNIGLLIPHQANIRIIDHVIKKFNLPKDKVYVNLQKYGNTSAASIPIALDEAVADKKVHKGGIVVLAGFGAGLTYGANVIRWG
ncbi:ketoacyl-ACP synthase III [Candidatus Saganbacteria bacterium]|nr:ketoacyl-ACP synthase III [Candidatus Saganbacteria bacterium]